jgi:thiamine biosynthesis protein ThiS
MSVTVQIRLNGDPYELTGPLTVAELLARLGIDARRVAVEHNLTVVKRDAFNTTRLAEGDEVEIVNFVGGGWRTTNK